jgi:hypothetical protein
VSVTLERDRRFSESLLWRMQRRFYEGAGVQAFGSNAVPHYVTNNPAIADAYARVVLAHLRDRARAATRAGGRVYVIELGAGAGRFAFHFLRRLAPWLEAASLDVPVTYVMTDVVPSLVEHWRAHPRLRGFVERGLLDFARFDAGHPAPLDLVESGVTLAPGSLAQPVVAVANYVFDSLPCDCFGIRSGVVHEGVATLTSAGPVADPEDPRLLSAVQLEMSMREATAPYFGDPALDAVLARYREQGDVTFTFPTAALASCDYLAALGGGLFAIAADRGLADLAGLRAHAEPELRMHGGCFSVRVNLHAIGLRVEAAGGVVFRPRRRHPPLEVMAFATGAAAAGPEVAAAFRDAFEDSGPDDVYAMKRAVQDSAERLPLSQLLAHVRLMRFDHDALWSCAQAILRRIGEATASERGELPAIAARVWDAYFPIGEQEDLARVLASICVLAGAPGDALDHARRSIELHGEGRENLFVTARAQQALGDRAGALATLDRLAALDASFAPARALRAELERA